MNDVWKDKRVLITGGLGFVGSTLALALVDRGARVTILDNLAAHQGGNRFNISPIKKDVDVVIGDIRDAELIGRLVKRKDYIFHLARQTDHILSFTDPFLDVDVNIRGTLVLLEACKRYNRDVRFIYTGTRGQYGKAVILPAPEDAPTNPKGIYEITNLTAEKIIQVYHSAHGIRSILLRLTNIYGPRSQMKHDHYGVVNWFVRLALDNDVIPVFGDGTLVRDFLYIDDAVSALLGSAETDACYGEILNVGRPTGETFLRLIRSIVRISGSGSYEFRPFTRERLLQEPGNFTSDIHKIKRRTGWKPTTSLSTGLRKTIEYYKEYKREYWQ
ncbi:MAG: GDP-mannose 4,6-dehydratase [bacterium]|nr:GDP-mannose 4,6-dehydratase [bacterium]